MNISPSMIQSLKKRVQAVIDQGHEADVALTSREQKRRLVSEVSTLARTGAGPLLTLFREAGIEQTLDAFPPDIRFFARACLSSRIPHAHGLKHSLFPAAFDIPGITLYEPMGWQYAFHADKSRFRVLACGRRAGKTTACAWEARQAALENPGVLVWLVFPVFSQAERVFNQLVDSLPKAVVEKLSYTKLAMKLMNGSWIECKSGESLDSLRGSGLFTLIIDECETIPGEVWTRILQPSLMDSRGRGVLIGTPRKKGSWFHECYLKGLAGETGWSYMRVESWQNRRIFTGANDPEILRLKATLPVDIFMSEIEAKWIDGGGQVFRGLDQVLRGPILSEAFPCTIEKPHPEKSYVVGCDLGRCVDFTALAVLDRQTGAVVYLDRINQTSWGAVKHLILETVRAYNDASLYVDQTGLGDVITEDLKAARVHVQGVKFSNTLKSDLVSRLQITIEQGAIILPRHPVLIAELENYSFELLPSGLIRYAAAGSGHDDVVTALMLAVWGGRNAFAWSEYKPQHDYKFLPGIFFGDDRPRLRGLDLASGNWTDEDL